MTAEPPPENERQRSLHRLRRYYEIAAQREWDRLENPADGALEFIVNKAYIGRHLPPAGARVLDIGGGPGRYAIWLADQGYRVTLADLSPELLALAREKAAEASVELEAVVEADAADLSRFEAASFDAVLCLGPFYHLIFEDDRQQAAREVARVLRPGGPVFAAFMSRLLLLRSILHGFFPLSRYMLKEYETWLGEGTWISPVPGMFTDGYFIRPQEIRPFMEAAGFRTIDIVASESVAADLQRQVWDIDASDGGMRHWLLERIIDCANEPTILGMANHLLYIGQRR